MAEDKSFAHVAYVFQRAGEEVLLLGGWPLRRVIYSLTQRVVSAPDHISQSAQSRLGRLLYIPT